MKILTLILFFVFTSFAQTARQLPVTVNSLTELQNYDGDFNSVIILVGKDSRDDGKGGIFRFDMNSTEAEDTAYMRVIKPNSVATGRWKRINTKIEVLPHGILLDNQGVKTFYASTVTDANGEVTLNLTRENTSTGTAFCQEIKYNDARSTVVATSVSSAVQSYVKNTTANLKQSTYGFYRANALTITLGLVYNPCASVGAGVPVQFRVECI